MNFSSISRHSLIGKLLRLPLNLLPSEFSVPILQGKLKGKRWVVDASTHGCWLGSYEFEKQQLFNNTVTAGNTVFDIGAHVGFYTLLASVLVGKSGQVVAFEPVPRNLNYLQRHIKLNQLRNVTIIPAAVADSAGRATFAEAHSSSEGHFSTTGNLEVMVVTLDEQVKTGQLPKPDVIKIDVEGAEFAVLSGARQTLKQYQPVIFLATHGEAVHKQCCSLLQSLNYSLKSINGQSVDTTDEILAIPSKVDVV